MILRDVREGRIPIEEARRVLGEPPSIERLAFATIDHEREARTGLPEVVYGAGKTVAQVRTIAERLWTRSGKLFATRIDADQAAAIREVVPEARHNPVARTASAGAPDEREGAPVAVVTAGTSDLPVAEEAIETLRMTGEPTIRLNDVGVAGIGRILTRRDEIERSAAVIVVAGMDGALPSVIGGIVSIPVIAVPTRVGYGASFEGLAPLLTMLNSCAPGVSVVNIDNGFGAAVVASRIGARHRSAREAHRVTESGGACA